MSTAAKRQPILIIAALSVIVLSATGVAAMMGWLPTSWSFGVHAIFQNEKWPPSSPQPPNDFTGDGSISFEGWQQVFTSGSREDAVGVGVEVRSQDIVVEGNIFEAEIVKGLYAQSQFEVVYFNDQETWLRMKPDSDDLFLLIQRGGSFSPSRGPIIPGFQVPGARALLGSVEYELREDGWYVDEELVGPVGSAEPK